MTPTLWWLVGIVAVLLILRLFHKDCRWCGVYGVVKPHRHLGDRTWEMRCETCGGRFLELR